jgi:tripartite-type tricarboxylate transporter receptor subunit TctC
MNRRCISMMSLFHAAAVMLPASALGQTYPAKPVRMILPYLGGTDFVGRWIAAKMSPSLGQQVIVDPRPGAGGNIGHEATARAAPDGYTMMLASVPLVLNPILSPELSYSVAKDFTPITLVATLPNVLAVHPSVPARSVKELVQLARANPGKVAYGAGAKGTTSHLAGELLKSLAKIDMLIVPYKGATFALVGAMSGEVDVVIPSASAIESYVKANRMRALAVLDTKRLDSMPDLPTAAEAGMPGLLIVNWYVLAAPANTPRAIVERLNAEAAKVMQAADTQKQLARLGGQAVVSTPEEASAFLRAEHERWRKVIQEARIN